MASDKSVVPATLAMLAVLCATGCERGPQKATWHEFEYLDSPAYRLVCDDSSKVIGTVERYPKDSPWLVFGGDGASYGEFVDLDAAKKHAEKITRTMESHLVQCP